MRENFDLKCVQSAVNIYIKSARDNFDEFINQFQPKTETLIRKHERILKKFIDKMFFCYLIKHA